MGEIAGMVIVSVITLSIVGIVWVISTNTRRRHASRDVADLHARLLDRCAGNQELLQYLESDAGSRFLQSATTESSNPLGRILTAIQAGATLFLLGAAGLLISRTDPDPDVRRGLLILGAGALALGLGFLISAVVSYSLCKSWGILKPFEGPGART